MNLSCQSQDLYRILLSAKNPLSANELARKLGIFPQTVYRLAKPLTNIGLINKTNKYPCQFVARSIDEGLSLFLLHQNDWFYQRFSDSQPKKIMSKEKRLQESPGVKISFIQSRDELFNLSIEEINRTKISIDLLRSGQEIPAEVMLALLRAKERKVRTRMLIQNYSSESSEQIHNWQQNGILVKKTNLQHIRLMVYDSKVLYFMSYRHPDSDKDLGLKIDYPPFATIISQLFNQWWQKAEVIRNKQNL